MSLDHHKIARLRKALGLSQVDAARAAELSRQGWINIETGREPNPTIDTISRVCRVLKISPDDVCSWK